ncbi:MAG: tRNA (N6-threonylcarbamoyladenosine(37)-N6)-methyltransferase TrmO [Chloroflexota bacterium]
MDLRPIGFVRSEIKESVRRDWRKVVSEIVIDAKLTEALDGLEGFSHIIVLFWMHQASREEPLKTHPMGKKEIPLMGRFATRAPNRPNLIGETIVKLLKRQGNILTVEGLDAIDGTPVIDIKPYIPEDLGEVKIPEWVPRH